MPKYGPGVVGEKAFEEEKEVEESGAHKYGPAVTAKHPAGTDPAAGIADEAEKREAEEIDAEDAEEILDDAAGDDEYANLSEFREALDDDPEKVAGFLEVELNREDGPRKGALQTLRKVETSEDGLNRPDVLSMIDDTLEALDSEE